MTSTPPTSSRNVVLEVDELLRAEVEHRLTVRGASGPDDVGRLWDARSVDREARWDRASPRELDPAATDVQLALDDVGAGFVHARRRFLASRVLTVKSTSGDTKRRTVNGKPGYSDGR